MSSVFVRVGGRTHPAYAGEHNNEYETRHSCWVSYFAQRVDPFAHARTAALPRPRRRALDRKLRLFVQLLAFADDAQHPLCERGSVGFQHPTIANEVVSVRVPADVLARRENAVADVVIDEIIGRAAARGERSKTADHRLEDRSCEALAMVGVDVRVCAAVERNKEFAFSNDAAIALGNATCARIAPPHEIPGGGIARFHSGGGDAKTDRAGERVNVAQRVPCGSVAHDQ